MYDETFEVVNAVEVKSPSASESDEEIKMAGKFNPPKVHQINSDDYDDTDTESDPDGGVLNRFGIKQRERVSTAQRPKSAAKIPAERTRHNSGRTTENSDTDESNEDLEQVQEKEENGERATPPPVWPLRGVYDPKKYSNLKVTPELESIFQYIDRYTPQKIEIEFKLEPFIPEFIPAVGDVDPFIKVNNPSKNVDGTDLDDQALEFIDGLGLSILDEPSAKQSEAALLNLQLRAKSKTSSAKSIVTKKLADPEKNTKAIDRWIKDVGDLHISTPSPNVVYSCKMPELDTLMEEWPEGVEETLNNVGFPPSNIDCTLTEYVDLICGILDIPISEDTLNARLQAMHLLFTLYSAVKSSQLFVERQKEESAI